MARSKTLLTCVNRAGIEVAEMVFEPLAAAEAVLTPDERDLGALLVDIGAGTAGFALFADGEMEHSAVLPIGAGHFTNDLAMVLRTPYAEAERIKIKEGCCLASMVQDEEGVSVPAVAGGAARVVPKREICEILQPRAEELLCQAPTWQERLGRSARAAWSHHGGAQLTACSRSGQASASVRFGRRRGSRVCRRDQLPAGRPRVAAHAWPRTRTPSAERRQLSPA
jgi:cell division ATPase FtsA